MQSIECAMQSIECAMQSVDFTLIQYQFFIWLMAQDVVNSIIQYV